MPRLVVVATRCERPTRIAHHEPVAPGVRRHPRAGRGGGPVGVFPRRDAAERGDVEDGAELMLRMPGSRARAERLLVAADLNPVAKRRGLLLVAAVGAHD